jgi:hypothetical protein
MPATPRWTSCVELPSRARRLVLAGLDERYEPPSDRSAAPPDPTLYVARISVRNCDAGSIGRQLTLGGR